MRRPAFLRVVLGVAGGLTALAVLLVDAPDSAGAGRADDAGRANVRVERGRAGKNVAPELRIRSPLPMLQLPADAPASLVATATDPEDGELGRAVRWRSSRDGFLGSGANLKHALSLGLHTLTAEVRDKGGDVT